MNRINNNTRLLPNTLGASGIHGIWINADGPILDQSLFVRRSFLLLNVP